jgi:hypothetical protein
MALAVWPLLSANEDQAHLDNVGTMPARRGFPSFDITGNGQQMVIFLDDEAFEAPLPDMAAGAVMAVIAPDVAGHELLHAPAQVIGLHRSEQQVKVVRHQTEGEQVEGIAFCHFGQ